MPNIVYLHVFIVCCKIECRILNFFLLWIMPSGVVMKIVFVVVVVVGIIITILDWK